uniref:Uncharacterized protein n=1 Tax=viral metagenome TaxID=1070528 RepID=A0A6C0C7F1_9ZZZZ
MLTRNGFLFRFVKSRRTLSAATCAGLCAYYFSEKHKQEKEYNDRINYLLTNKVELSGVYLQERPPFSKLWGIHWLLPRHQSLKFVFSDGVVQYGLGKENDSFFDRSVKFVCHTGEKYIYLNKKEISIPLEAYRGYYDKYGHYPDVDVDKLFNLVTSEKYDKKFFDSIPGEFNIVTCRSALMDFVHRADKNQ